MASARAAAACSPRSRASSTSASMSNAFAWSVTWSVGSTSLSARLDEGGLDLGFGGRAVDMVDEESGGASPAPHSPQNLKRLVVGDLVRSTIECYGPLLCNVSGPRERLVKHEDEGASPKIAKRLEAMLDIEPAATGASPGPAT